ncbi:hypothetical protein [Chondromyces apiculatus]|uniref:hypothetical protein n=1 Tax=Chondromyces apiculatus TaxID=51 RepID=UPI0012DDD944|nr:hypothetical protein [Chondromyces apiculatus]
MAIPSNPVPEFCAACGFPLRGPRCEACGVHRTAPGRRTGLTPDSEPQPPDAELEAWRARDPIRFVGHCIASEVGTTVPTTSAQEGIGWIFSLQATTLFVSFDPGAERTSIDVPLTRVIERQRVPLLRAALELCDQLLPARLCLRDDLLVLRRTAHLPTLTASALRLALRTTAAAAERVATLLVSWFDVRPTFSDEQRANLSWALVGRSRPLKSFSIPPPGRSLPPPFAPQGTPQVLPPPPPLSGRLAAAEALWAAPRAPEPAPGASARPVHRETPHREPASREPASREAASRDADELPDILSPFFVVTSSTSTPLPGLAAPPSTITPPPVPTPPTYVRRATPLPVPPSSPSDLRALYGGMGGTLGGLPGESRASEVPAPLVERGSTRRPGIGEVSSPPVSVPFSMRPPAASSEGEPDARRERPASDRFCQILRDAQAHATTVSIQDKPGVMLILIRSTVFRAILEHGDTLPHTVAHLYRATAAVTRDLAQAENAGRRVNPAAIAEPALYAMERLVSARGQVPDEKPLQIEPLTSATHAREHLSRFLREIEAAPSDPALRHFLALGALSELLVRAKLPAKTDQRLREIVAYAHRDGVKGATIDLMMTALNRIVSQ